MYQQCKDSFNNISTTCIKRLVDNAFIPLNPDNTDYQQFKRDIQNGVQLSDANNNIMTANQISSFIATLP